MQGSVDFVKKCTHGRRHLGFVCGADQNAVSARSVVGATSLQFVASTTKKLNAGLSNWFADSKLYIKLKSSLHIFTSLLK